MEKRKCSEVEDDQEDISEDAIESVDGLKAPAISKEKIIRPKLFKSARNQTQRLIVILESANLESVKVGNRFELINCDDHINQIRKYKKDPAFCRPDITHQVKLSLIF
jgi:probable ribosome biogenesis protein NEP1